MQQKVKIELSAIGNRRPIIVASHRHVFPALNRQQARPLPSGDV